MSFRNNNWRQSRYSNNNNQRQPSLESCVTRYICQIQKSKFDLNVYNESLTNFEEQYQVPQYTAFKYGLNTLINFSERNPKLGSAIQILSSESEFENYRTQQYDDYVSNTYNEIIRRTISNSYELNDALRKFIFNCDIKLIIKDYNTFLSNKMFSKFDKEKIHEQALYYLKSAAKTNQVLNKFLNNEILNNKNQVLTPSKINFQVDKFIKFNANKLTYNEYEEFMSRNELDNEYLGKKLRHLALFEGMYYLIRYASEYDNLIDIIQEIYKREKLIPLNTCEPEPKRSLFSAFYHYHSESEKKGTNEKIKNLVELIQKKNPIDIFVLNFVNETCLHSLVSWCNDKLAICCDEESKKMTMLDADLRIGYIVNSLTNEYLENHINKFMKSIFDILKNEKFFENISYRLFNSDSENEQIILLNKDTKNTFIVFNELIKNNAKNELHFINTSRLFINEKLTIELIVKNIMLLLKSSYPKDKLNILSETDNKYYDKYLALFTLIWDTEIIKTDGVDSYKCYELYLSIKQEIKEIVFKELQNDIYFNNQLDKVNMNAGLREIFTSNEEYNLYLDDQFKQFIVTDAQKNSYYSVLGDVIIKYMRNTPSAMKKFSKYLNVLLKQSNIHPNLRNGIICKICVSLQESKINNYRHLTLLKDLEQVNIDFIIDTANYLMINKNYIDYLYSIIISMNYDKQLKLIDTYTDILLICATKKEFVNIIKKFSEKYKDHTLITNNENAQKIFNYWKQM